MCASSLGPRVIYLADRYYVYIYIYEIAASRRIAMTQRVAAARSTGLDFHQINISAAARDRRRSYNIHELYTYPCFVVCSFFLALD